jgi:3-phosphoshikimate 1-carboxyvinyltransferase
MTSAALAIRPLEHPPDATVTVPGSKSITNRALLLAALADGRSELSGALFSDDTRYMIAALRALGVGVGADEAAARIVVDGCGGAWPIREANLFVGNAGTAMRFLVAACCLGTGQFRLDGAARMRERPIGELVDALRQLGADIAAPGGVPPVTVRGFGMERIGDASRGTGVSARGWLTGGRAELSAARSSQFLSALLQVAAYAEEDVTIALVGDVIAQPYVDMTVAVMAQWGVAVERDGYREFRVRAGQRYRARAYAVEPDASSAHYFLAAAALTGGRVRVSGLGRDSLQGDVRFADLLAAMGATVDWKPAALRVAGAPQLGGIDADLNAISDTAMTLAVLAPFASAPVRIRNVAHLRWQESDRLHAVATELGKLGAHVRELDDGLVIEPSALHGGVVETYDDHRVAMAFALIGLRVPGIVIENPQCVAKTFPDFFERLESLRR